MKLVVICGDGLNHRPVGTTLFITSSIAEVRMGDVVYELFYAVASAYSPR